MQHLDKDLRKQPLNQDWKFSLGMYDILAELQGNTGKSVNLPHDYMIEQDVVETAPAGPAMGFYDGKTASYTKKTVIPAEWKGREILLHFDGVMMNAVVDVNGSRTTLHHNGYTPFQVNITPYIYWGRENRITVTCNPNMQPNSRWYTGAGIYRHVTIENRDLLHIAADGIYAYTQNLDEDAHLITEVTIENHSLENRMTEVEVTLTPNTFAGESITRRTSVFVKAQGSTVARIPVTVEAPVLWDAETPNLYDITVGIKEKGVFGVCLEENTENPMSDSQTILFGIRTIQADPKHGLRINGKTVKLKGGCIHHDNGILGAVSLYDSEYRKLKKLKELGYNAVRMAHNPPSAIQLEVCDRLGLYVFNEAFDCWGMAKIPGDYSQYFDTDWRRDVDCFVKRDRNHPSIILWSSGNEIVERGGLGNGYQIATELAEHIRSLDRTRLITNGLCSYWSGLDDEANMKGAKAFLAAMSGDVTQMQNAADNSADTSWEDRSEAFVNSLDVVGYNYLEDHYEMNGIMYPERVIVGTESYPSKMQEVWKLVEKLPYVIGDFTWTAIDYIGEAGIGKSIFGEADDPAIKAGPFSLMSHSSRFPWRLGNDADLDILGDMMPQGAMRKLLWGGSDTSIYVVDPAHYGMEELISMWGWTDITPSWCWSGSEGKTVTVIVYSAADEVELVLNHKSLGISKVENFTARFDITYQSGILKALGRKEGTVISEAELVTAKEAADIRLVPEKVSIKADGDSLCYVRVEVVDEDGIVVRNSEIALSATVEGAGTLAGFGSSNPLTDENYTTGRFKAYHGTAMAVVRSSYEPGEILLNVQTDTLYKSVRISSV